MCRACMEAVAWMHGQGVVHRSLGSDSLLLSTYDPQEQAPRVTITNLGFATTATRVTPEEVTAAMERGAQGPLDVIPFLTRIDDLYALAYVPRGREIG